jgi:hypothetical protein
MSKLLGVLGLMLCAGTAAAEPMAVAPGSVQVAIVDESGAPVYCTRADTGGHGHPVADGGYRLDDLRPGRWIVRLDLPYERVDVVVTATAGETVVVPPVVARGRCQSIVVTRRLDLRQRVAAQAATWSVSFGRTYAAHAVAPPALAARLPLPIVAKARVTPRPIAGAGAGAGGFGEAPGGF